MAEFETLQKLHVRMKRYWYVKTLERVESDAGRETDDEVGRSRRDRRLADAIRDFRPFLLQHLTVEHIDLAERFVMASALCPSDEISGLLHDLLDETAKTAAEMAAGNGAQRSDRIITPNDPVTPFAALTPFPATNELLERIDLAQGLLRRLEMTGKEMPVWGHDLAGNVFDAKTLEGKVVLLDFWATWCAPCVAEFPHLKNLYEKYHDRGFEIVGYNVDSDLEQLTAFLRRRPLPWPVLVREKSLEKGAVSLSEPPLPEMPLSTYYGARKLPVVLLRDRDGKVVMLDARGGALAEVLERLLANHTTWCG